MDTKNTINRFAQTCNLDSRILDTICTHAVTNAVMFNLVKKWLNESVVTEKSQLLADMTFYANWLRNPNMRVISC